MIFIDLETAKAGVEPLELPDGQPGQRLFFVDEQSGIVVRCTFNQEQAKQLGSALTAPSVLLARAMPPQPRPIVDRPQA